MTILGWLRFKVWPSVRNGDNQRDTDYYRNDNSYGMVTNLGLITILRMVTVQGVVTVLGMNIIAIFPFFFVTTFPHKTEPQIKKLI